MSVVCYCRAVELDFEEMVQQILLMYSKHNGPEASENTKKCLLGVMEDHWSAFHLATEQKCVKAFRALLAYSGFPLTDIVNFYPKGCEQSLGEKVTPLSSILINCNDDNNPMMDALLEFDKNYKQHGNYPITNVNLSYTYIGSLLHPIIFQFKSIRSIKASHMQLNDLPFHELPYYSHLLTQLDISSNNLNSLPEELFTCLNLENLNVSYNPLKCLPENWWKSQSLCCFLASFIRLVEVFSSKLSSKLSDPPSQEYAKPAVYQRPFREISHFAVFEGQTVSKLKELNLAGNDITEFPRCFACIFPQLENLNLSKNKLKKLCDIQELPAALVRLDLSHNWLSSSDTIPFTYSPAGSCFISQNVSCCHMLHCELPQLKELFLSQNHNLSALNFTYLPPDNLLLSLHGDHNFEQVFFPNLKKLQIDYCQLRQLPCRLDLMENLHSLDISNNPIRRIPLEICNLEKLEELKYDNILDNLAYELDQHKTITAKRYYLKYFKDE